MSSTEIASLPIGPRVSYIISVLQKEKSMRHRALHGTDRINKIEEMDICLDYLKQINEMVIRHREMCGRLRECADRHNLEIGHDYLDRVVIRALDKAKEPALKG